VTVVEKEKLLFGKVKVVFHSGSRVLKIAVITLIVFSIIALTALTWVKVSIRQRTEDMRAEAAVLGEENVLLNEKIENLGTLESIKELALEFLGLADPETIIIETD